MAAICICYNDWEDNCKAHKIESICCQSTRENNDEFSCSYIYIFFFLDRMRKFSHFIASRNVGKYEFQLRYNANQLIFVITSLRHVL